MSAECGVFHSSPRLTIVDPDWLMLNHYKRTSKLRLYHFTSYKVIAISRGKFPKIVLFNVFFHLPRSAIFKLAPVFAQKSEGKRPTLHARGQFSVECKVKPEGIKRLFLGTRAWISDKINPTSVWKHKHHGKIRAYISLYVQLWSAHGWSWLRKAPK